MNREDPKMEMTDQCQLAQVIKRRPGGPEKWIGHTVKKGFAEIEMCDGAKEWMWVEITGVKDNQLVGTLVNEPFLATYLQYGDTVTMTEDDIFAVGT